MSYAEFLLDVWAVFISFGWVLLLVGLGGFAVSLVYLMWIVIRDRLGEP